MLWIVGIIVVFVLVLLVRAARFKPPVAEKAVPIDWDIDQDAAVEHLAAMIRCKTVSYKEEELIDWKEFEAFQALLAERFPRIHSACTLEKIGKTGLLYHLPGKAADRPSVCMAH